MKVAVPIIGGLISAANLLGGAVVATAHADPGVIVAPNGSRYYGEQGEPQCLRLSG
jgi:hypothetical protein